MQDSAKQVKAYMQEHGLTQRQLADKAGVSQPTVSRALKGETRRQGAGRTKLFKFVRVDESGRLLEAPQGRERIMAAAQRMWDGTEEHADAIVHILDALGALCPPSDTKSGG